MCSSDLGCALATHGVAILILPGLVLLLFPRILRVGARTIAHAIGHVVFPNLLYLYLPIRSNDVFARGLDPTVTILGLKPGRPYWDFGHPATPPELLHYLLGGDDSAVSAGFRSMLDPFVYPHVVATFVGGAVHEFGAIALILAAAGVFLLARAQWYETLGLVVTGLPCIPYGLLYLEADPDRYMLMAYWLIATLAAVGLSRLLALVLERRSLLAEGFGVAVAFGLAAGIFAANRHDFDGRNDTSPTDFINRVIARTPPNAILVANWAYATTLGYAAYVDRSLGDRILVTAFAGQFESFYPRWSTLRPIYMVNQMYASSNFRTVTTSNDPLLVQLIPK